MSAAGDKSNILEALEACRADSDDLQLPEMSHLAETLGDDDELRQRLADVQRSDAGLKNAFRDVPTPDGLQERLLAALAEAEAESEEATLTDEKPTPAHRSTSPSRRWFLVGSTAAALALAVGIGALIMNWRGPLDANTWATSAMQLQSSLSQSAWEMDKPEPAQRPAFDRWQRGVTGQGWQPIDNPWDDEAVAYRLFNRGGTTATLFVFQPRSVDANLPLAPPTEPVQRTSLSTAGVWTNNGLVYVLVVNGGVQQYQSFLRPNQIAWQAPLNLAAPRS